MNMTLNHISTLMAGLNASISTLTTSMASLTTSVATLSASLQPPVQQPQQTAAVISDNVTN